MFDVYIFTFTLIAQVVLIGVCCMLLLMLQFSGAIWWTAIRFIFITGRIAVKRQTAGIKFTQRPKISIFAPQRRLVAQICVIFGISEGYVTTWIRFANRRAKFHDNRFTAIKLKISTFYRATRSIARYATATCMDGVCHTPVLYQNGYSKWNPFSIGVKCTQGRGKVGDFRRNFFPFISETVRDRPMVTTER